MPVAAAVVGASVIGSVASANAQKSAAKKAASAQADASRQAEQLTREQWARADQTYEPYQQAGNRADAALDARWGGSGAPAVDPYGAWGAALNQRPGSAYDAGRPTPAWTAQGTPQIQRMAAPTVAAPQQAPQWDWRSVNPQGLPPLPNLNRPSPTPAANPSQGQQNAYGSWTNWRGEIPNYYSAIL